MAMTFAVVYIENGDFVADFASGDSRAPVLGDEDD
jgi:hypothetical protein